MAIRNHLFGRSAICLRVLFRGSEIAWGETKGFAAAGPIKAVAK